jgi:hypothetical protein
MNWKKPLVLLVALGMMAATGGSLVVIRQHEHLGVPGVLVGPEIIYDETGKVAARESVLLPDAVLGIRGENLPVTRSELEGLPADTTYGRKTYARKDGSRVVTSVVLMKNDRASIHQPEFCLVGQGWQIIKSERVLLPMDRPYPYQLPALKLTTSRIVLDEHKQPLALRGFYVYWFVSGDRITSEQGARMWSIATRMLEKGELERWAYISYFVICLPEQEDATYKELERFICASVPDFQTVAGQPAPARNPVATHQAP